MFHQRLLLKLKAHGIGDDVIIKWTDKWLTDRRQRVVEDGETSSKKSVCEHKHGCRRSAVTYNCRQHQDKETKTVFSNKIMNDNGKAFTNRYTRYTRLKTKRLSNKCRSRLLYYSLYISLGLSLLPCRVVLLEFRCFASSGNFRPRAIHWSIHVYFQLIRLVSHDDCSV